MAYMSSSAPLPQNSLMPPPADEVRASNARILQSFLASRTGRERLYANIPTAAELWEVSPGLAVDANQRLGESEYARQSILVGLGLPSDLSGASLAQVRSNAPQVVSLNGAVTTAGGLDTTQNGLMPAPAPVPTVGGLWASKQLPNESTKTWYSTESKKRNLQGMASPQNVSFDNVGPGCRPVTFFSTGSQPVTTLPVPIPASNPPSPQSVTADRTQNCAFSRCTVHMVPSPTANYPRHATVIDDPTSSGPTVQFEDASYAPPYYAALGITVVGSGLSGFAPTWGDAWAGEGELASGGSGLSVWLVMAAAAGAVGLAGWFDKRRRR